MNTDKKTEEESFIHPVLGEVFGYSNIEEFDEACKKWEKENEKHHPFSQ
jgi:hypothetical protein